MKWVAKYVENVCPGIRLRLAMPLTETKTITKSKLIDTITKTKTNFKSISLLNLKL